MIALDTPIYDELAEKHDIHIAYPLESDPVHALLAARESTQLALPPSPCPRAEVTQALPVVHAVDPDQMPPEDGHAHGLRRRGDPVISSPNRSRRSGAPVRLVCIHTAEGARTVESLGRYFQNASVQASSHVGIDDRGIEQYVPYTEASWTLRSGNSVSDNAELCGFARWSRAEWVTQHEQMLRRTAAWIAERCAARGIPLRKLTPEQVRRGEAGVIGHHDWTVGMRDGTHTDPGPGFPWDVVMALASTGATRLPAAPPSPTPPAPREDSTVLENIPVHGAGGFRRIIPIGKASSILARAWVSLVTDGPAGASAKVFFQSDGGGLADRQLSVIFRDGWSSRDWAELPDGTTQIVVQYDAPDGAIVALEAAPK